MSNGRTSATRKSKPHADKAPDDAAVSGRGNWLTRLLFRPRVLIVLALLVSSTAVGPLLMRLLPDLRGREEYRVPTAEIRVTDPPRWVPSDLVEQVAENAALPDELSLLDEDLTAEVAEAFRLHPWVAEVVRVRKSIADGVTVELCYRRPVAMVAVPGGMYPVDCDGNLLPPTDFSVADTERFPVIRGIESTPQGPPGTSWGDVAVLGAARVAEALSERWKSFNLAAVRPVASERSIATIDDLQFALITHSGSRIVWGRPPGSDHPGELSVDQKIGRMEKYRDDFGGFARPHGPYEIDIRHWREISRRPLSTAARANERR